MSAFNKGNASQFGPLERCRWTEMTMSTGATHNPNRRLILLTQAQADRQPARYFILLHPWHVRDVVPTVQETLETLSRWCPSDTKKTWEMPPPELSERRDDHVVKPGGPSPRMMLTLGKKNPSSLWRNAKTVTADAFDDLSARSTGGL